MLQRKYPFLLLLFCNLWKVQVWIHESRLNFWIIQCFRVDALTRVKRSSMEYWWLNLTSPLIPPIQIVTIYFVWLIILLSRTYPLKRIPPNILSPSSLTWMMQTHVQTMMISRWLRTNLPTSMEVAALGEPSKKKTAYFMTSGKLGFWPTYPPEFGQNNLWQFD